MNKYNVKSGDLYVDTVTSKIVRLLMFSNVAGYGEVIYRQSGRREIINLERLEPYEFRLQTNLQTESTTPENNTSSTGSKLSHYSQWNRFKQRNSQIFQK